MAVTKIWTIKDSLQRVLDYAANPDKTEYDALAQTLHYAENDAKTKLNESAQLVTGIHCRANHAWEDMRAVQERFGKTDGVVALHAYQSFREGEVTPEQCHEIGVALARKVWGKRFQVLVATHIQYERVCVSGISAALGMPGGVAMAATIPADIAQYYGYMLRATQKLMYLYGFTQIDVEGNGQVFDSETMNLLILCMGVMYGVVGANNALKAVAKALGTGVEKQLLRRALTKGTIYPIVKSVSKWFGVRMTKQIFAGVFKKAIPVVGGVLGGGITYLSFKPCCDKLKASLQNTILSNPDYQNSETEDAILAEFADVTTSGYEAVPGTV